MKFCEVTEEEFANFAKKSEAASFLQSVEMYHRYKERKNEAYLLGVKEKGKIVAVGLVVSKYRVLKKKIFICPRGFLADFKAKIFPEVSKTFTDGAKEFLKRRKGAVLEISPNLTRTAVVDKDGVPTENFCGSKEEKMFTDLGYKNLGEYEFVKWEYFLDTSKLEADKLLTHIRSGHRYATRLALERYQMRMRELDEKELSILKDLSDEAAERHGFVTPSLTYYKEMKKAFSDDVKFYVAEVAKKVVKAAEAGKEPAEIKKIAAEITEKDEFIPVAAAMFVFSKNEVVYLYSGSSSKYSKYGGPHFLQYMMIKKTIGMGVKKYNFYGTNPKAGDGVYEFKRGYHGELREYIGTFMLPITPVGKIYVARKKYQDVRDIH